MPKSKTLELGDSFNFDTLDLKEFKFTYLKTQYVLEVASEECVAKYNDSISSGMMIGEIHEGVSSDIKISGHSKANAILLSGCVKEINTKDGTRRPVPINVINGWPHPVTKPLYEKAKIMAGMDTDEDGKSPAEDNAKNSQEGTTASSGTPST